MLQRFEATVVELKQRSDDDARRYGMTKDFGDEYFAAAVAVSEWLSEAKSHLASARNELAAYVGD